MGEGRGGNFYNDVVLYAVNEVNVIIITAPPATNKIVERDLRRL